MVVGSLTPQHMGICIDRHGGVKDRRANRQMMKDVSLLQIDDDGHHPHLQINLSLGPADKRHSPSLPES
jgi:hypothetical protein